MVHYQIMIKGGWKSIAFLAATAGVLGWEVFASWDNDPTSSPWTDLIVTYIPGEVTAAILGGLIAWLPIHFGLRYWNKNRRHQNDNEDRL